MPAVSQVHSLPDPSYAPCTEDGQPDLTQAEEPLKLNFVDIETESQRRAAQRTPVGMPNAYQRQHCQLFRWGQSVAVTNDARFVFGGRTDPYNTYGYTSTPWNNDPHLIMAVRLGAIRKNDTVTITQLIEDGEDVNRHNHVGRTPLHVAIMSNSVECSNILIDSLTLVRA
jgi:hypothetical protein